MSGFDFVRKVWRYSRRGYVVHAHANGDSPTGAALAITAEILNLLSGRRPFLTFHAGVQQRHFPRDRSGRLTLMFRLLFALPRRIICNSEPVKACIAAYGVEAGEDRRDPGVQPAVPGIPHGAAAGRRSRSSSADIRRPCSPTCGCGRCSIRSR